LSKPQQIVVVQAAPSANVAAIDPKIDKPQASVEVAVAVGEPTTDSTGAPVIRPGALPGTGGPKPKSSTSGAAIDTSGFTSTIPGPSTAQAPPPSGAGGQLSAGEIQGVVAQNQAIVKRKCWQPALESRAANAPTNARVNGSITIGAGGNVESASASGGERDFPGLSSCIASRMKGWKFPASSSSTPVNVPFVFAGQ
ncbi:MAG: AgmX/PglI C-terminal domain-containing protein, partial [Byssovorax sp.]